MTNAREDISMTPSPSSQDRLKGQIGCTIHDYKNGVIDADVAVNAILELTRPTPDLGNVDELVAFLQNEARLYEAKLRPHTICGARNDSYVSPKAEETMFWKAADKLIALRAALDKND